MELVDEDGPDIPRQRQKLRRELLLLTMPTPRHFISLDDYDINAVSEGLFSLDHGGLRFDCLLHRHDSAGSPLFVILSGLRNPDKHPVPKFDRLSFAPLFPGHVLYVSDPVHHHPQAKLLRTGWYLGDERQPGIPALAELVQYIRIELGAARYPLVCYGSSAGGFAAACLASELAEAVAVAINPQTRLWHFGGLFTAWLRTCYPSLNPQTIVKQGHHLFDLHSRLQKPGVRLLYVQNQLDKLHFQRYYQPFCQEFGFNALSDGLNRQGNLATYLYQDPAGHGGEPRSLAPELIAIALQMAEGSKTIAA
ncbi:hypothetical protein INR99_00650 [Chitinilyticum litopenaei]|uniref:Uncharacterized protein n=2 Tax=Chitinilyticum piscinae TaxID=2866724 RepID=A0A8J7K9B8_9NEIS|nr:hypothetical protein [Chitinilyticum piscinae]